MAEKLQTFNLIRELFQKIGIHSCPVNQNRNYNLRNTFVLINFVQLFAGSATFLLFKAHSIEEYCLSFYLTTLSILLLVLWPCLIQNIDDLFNLMDQMDEFVQKRNASISKFLHDKTNKRIERVTKLIYIYFCKINGMTAMLTQLIRTIINYYILNMHDDAFYFDIPVILPFNWKTPLGYVVALFIITTIDICFRIFLTLIFCFYIGFCWLIISFVEDITNDLNVLTHDNGQNDQEIAETFYEIVDLYSTVEHLVVKFNQIYEFVPTGFILWCLSTICLALWLIQIRLENTASYLDVVNMFTSVIFLLGIISILTEFGQMLNNKFEAFDERLCQCVWYTFPITIQRNFPVFMMYSQDSVNIHGFGNTECTRETYKKVIHASWSYFMVLHQL